MTKKNAALALARQGFYVFPLNAKCTPAFKGWQESATCDPKQVEAMWDEDYNIGIATGRPFKDTNKYVNVFDIDVKDDKEGDRALALLEALYDPIPTTAETRTASGGRHILLLTDEPLANSVQKIGRGIDVRGRGGYVVGPGSTKNGNTYVAINDTAPVDCPEWLSSMAGAARERKAVELDPNFEWDTQEALDRATYYLQHEAPEAVEGDGGDKTTYDVMCRVVRDYGVSPEAALDLALEHYNDRCSPPWDAEDLHRKIMNAFEYGENALGRVRAESEFDAVEVDTAKPAPKSRLFWKRFEDAAPNAVADELVEGWIDAGAMSVWYGNSNVGKTFVMLSVAHAIGGARPWAGYKTAEGLVVYVAAEGGHSIETRLMALRQTAGEAKLAFIPCPVDLLHENADTKPLVRLIKEIAAAYSEPPKMIVVDTLSRALAGGNENASDDMGALVKNLDAIRAAFKAHVAIVHHKGKNEAAGARGHSLLRAATDTEIEVTEGKILATKQRDKEAAPELAFRLQPIEVARRADGTPIKSCIVEFVEAAEFETKLTPPQMRTYKALWKHVAKEVKMKAAWIKEHENTDNPPVTDAMKLSGLSVLDVREIVRKTGSGKGLSRSTVYEHLGALSENVRIRYGADNTVFLV